jgi:hypothetical protein
MPRMRQARASKCDSAQALEPEGDVRQGIRATGAPSQIRDGATVTVMLRFTDDPRFMDAAR